MTDVAGSGTAEDHWVLSTPPGGSEFEAWRDEAAGPPPPWSRSARPSCATSCAASTTCTPC